MKLKQEFITHTLDGEQYMISTNRTNFNGMIKNNETSAFIVDCLKTDTTENVIVDKLISEYKGADRPTVEHDVTNIIGKLRSIEAIEE